jgi:hypothetical protein
MVSRSNASACERQRNLKISPPSFGRREAKMEEAISRNGHRGERLFVRRNQGSVERIRVGRN